LLCDGGPQFAAALVPGDRVPVALLLEFGLEVAIALGVLG
jgi:hypothetical protein